jgi:CRISPR-associated endonuclease/helicase Cas3
MQYLANPDLIAKLRAAIASICRAGPNDMVIRFKVGLLVRFLFSCLIDADRTDTADSAKPVAAALRQHGRYT